MKRKDKYADLVFAVMDALQVIGSDSRREIRRLRELIGMSQLRYVAPAQREPFSQEVEDHLEATIDGRIRQMSRLSAVRDGLLGSVRAFSDGSTWFYPARSSEAPVRIKGESDDES